MRGGEGYERAAGQLAAFVAAERAEVVVLSMTLRAMGGGGDARSGDVNALWREIRPRLDAS